jgi:uncharacterized protein (TIGR00369 family)
MTNDNLTKTRSYAYDRPVPLTPELASLSGIELIRRMAAGEIPAPSIASTLDFRLVEVEHGRVAFEGDPSDYVLNPMGGVHGGYTATLLDSAMGCAVHTMMGPGQSYTTVELKVNYVRGMRAGEGLIRCEGKVIHAGSTLLTAEGRLVRVADGKLVAHGTTTCMILRA